MHSTKQQHNNLLRISYIIILSHVYAAIDLPSVRISAHWYDQPNSLLRKGKMIIDVSLGRARRRYFSRARHDKPSFFIPKIRI